MEDQLPMSFCLKKELAWDDADPEVTRAELVDLMVETLSWRYVSPRHPDAAPDMDERLGTRIQEVSGYDH